MEDAPSAFSGVSFHCYSGNVTEQDIFHSAYPTKEIYFTECSGTQGSDWWSDIKVRPFSFLTPSPPAVTETVANHSGTWTTCTCLAS